MQKVMDGALRCEGDGDPPTTLIEFTTLRDALITRLMIVSLRRLMEFAEFRLSEYA